jgi:hypothetical protein
MTVEDGRLLRQGTDRDIVACIMAEEGGCPTVAFGVNPLVQDEYVLPVETATLVHATFIDGNCSISPFEFQPCELGRYFCDCDPGCGPYCEDDEGECE